MIREGFEVQFDCGHKMVYDKHSGQGVPDLGMYAWCRQCPSPLAKDYPGAGWTGAMAKVIAMRQCWIETTTQVHFEEPTPEREETKR